MPSPRAFRRRPLLLYTPRLTPTIFRSPPVGAGHARPATSPPPAVNLPPLTHSPKPPDPATRLPPTTPP